MCWRNELPLDEPSAESDLGIDSSMLRPGTGREEQYIESRLVISGGTTLTGTHHSDELISASKEKSIAPR